MDNKRPTNAQLQKRIANAIVHIDKTKDTHTAYFTDKGVRLTASEECAVIAFGHAKVVYDSFALSGICRPYLYTKRVIEIVEELAKDENVVGRIKTEAGYSFKGVLEVLGELEDKSQYNILTYYDWFIFNVFQPLYGIADDEVSSYLVYEDYLHNIARNMVILSEKDEDMTDKQFTAKVQSNMNELMSNLEERVIFHKKTDEEVANENMEAMMEMEQEQAMEAQVNGTE